MTIFKLIIFYCLTNFCNIKFFKYLVLGMFYLGLYSLFLLIKPSAVQYKLNISFCWGTYTLSFFMFKACEHVNDQTVYMWIFIFLIFPHSSKVLCYYPFSFLESLGLSSILTLIINVRLKVTRVLCILNSNGID